MSEPQNMTALAYANEIKARRAKISRDIKAGDDTVARVITDCPVEAERMTLLALLMTQHRWGCARSETLLRRLGISSSRKVRELTDRQRTLVVDALADTTRARTEAQAA